MLKISASPHETAAQAATGTDFQGACEGFRPWQFDTAHAHPWAHQSFGGAYTDTDLHPTAEYAVDEQTNFILGGSHDHGPMDTDEDGERWANAGFNFVSVPLPTAGAADELQAFAASLDIAKKRGMFVAVESKTKGTALDSASMLGINRAYGCHPNLGGHVLGRGLGASDVTGVCATAATLRQDRGYLLPFAMADDVSTMSALASGGVPVASVLVPPPLSSGGGNATSRAAATLSAYASVAAHVNSSSDLTFVASVDACSAGASDSLLRFASYASLAYGARGLWHAGIGGCLDGGGGGGSAGAGAGADGSMFEMVSSINRRIAHWVAPYGTVGRPVAYTYTLSGGISNRIHLFSTGWQVEGAERPQPGAFIESMSDHLLAVVYTAGATPNATLLYVVDKRVSDSR
jgi:hypothetical protein